jgi:hypothetical protein
LEISIGAKAFGRRLRDLLCVGGRRLARSAFGGRFQSAPRPSAGGSACTPNEFGLQGPSADGRPTPTGRRSFCVGGGRRLARSAFGGRFQSASKAFGGGRPAPIGRRFFCVGGGRRLARQRLERPISIGVKGLWRWSACADREKILLRRRRPTLGAERLGRPISIGAKASAGGSACTPNEFGLQGPLADGRPTPTGRRSFCVGGGRRLARSAWGGRFQSAPRPSAGGSVCTPNEFGLQGPLAGGRPTPTWKSTFCVGGGRRPARSA